MNMYLNYVKEYWIMFGEILLVGLVLCVGKGVGEVYYVLIGLLNIIMVSEYKV